MYAQRYNAPNDEFAGTIGGTERDAPGRMAISIHVLKRGSQQL